MFTPTLDVRMWSFRAMYNMLTTNLDVCICILCMWLTHRTCYNYFRSSYMTYDVVLVVHYMIILRYSLMIYCPFFVNAFCAYNLPCCLHITKTCLYNNDPMKPHFYIVKLRFTGVYIIFLIPQKHRLWLRVRTASARQF